MKKVLIIIILSFQLVVFAQDIPSSSRSREAIERVKPNLQIEFEKSGFRLGLPIFIRIFKEEKELEIWVESQNGYHLFRKYPICTFGNGSLGPKTKQGDGQAPEGFYYVTPNRLNPLSNFHLSFNLGYPNSYDRSYNRTGSALMVHGSCVSIGCYAMTNEKIEEIYAIADFAFRNGQRFFRVHIFPFKMTGEKMEKQIDSEWYSFWQNLKQGYDFFEEHSVPPNVDVQNGQYVFERM